MGFVPLPTPATPSDEGERAALLCRSHRGDSHRGALPRGPLLSLLAWHLSVGPTPAPTPLPCWGLGAPSPATLPTTQPHTLRVSPLLSPLLNCSSEAPAGCSP